MSGRYRTAIVLADARAAAPASPIASLALASPRRGMVVSAPAGDDPAFFQGPRTMTKPLPGRRVVSLEQAVAAPYCAARLADAGARVIKVERQEGDFARG